MNNKIILMIVFLISIVFALSSNVIAVTDFLQIDDYAIDYSYDEAEIDERFTLRVTITNEGNKNKTDVKFELDAVFPFNNLGDDDWDIDILESDESKTRTFRLEVSSNAEEDDYDLDFKLEDDDDEFDDSFEIEVVSNAADLIIGDVFSIPTTLAPDTEDIKLTVIIENTGDAAAEFVKSKLILPAGFKASNSYSDIASLGVINSGDSKEVSFFIDTNENLNSGLYQGKIELNYENDNHKKSKTLEFDLPVKGRPQFNIVGIETEPIMLISGMEEALIKLTIQNTGQEEGKETSIRVFEKVDHPFSFSEKTSFIGSLQPGQSGTGFFKFDIDSDAVSNEYLLKVQVRTVSEGNVLVNERTINIEIEENDEESKSFNYIWIIVGVLILVVGFLVFRLTKILKK